MEKKNYEVTITGSVVVAVESAESEDQAIEWAEDVIGGLSWQKDELTAVEVKTETNWDSVKRHSDEQVLDEPPLNEQ